jgi:hypothetical protein
VALALLIYQYLGKGRFIKESLWQKQEAYLTRWAVVFLATTATAKVSPMRLRRMSALRVSIALLGYFPSPLHED